MQQVYLDEFKTDIVNIREYIKHIELIHALAVVHKDAIEPSILEFNVHLNRFKTEKKIFEYKAIIISLYGIIERHMEIWAKEHIDNLTNLVSDYNKLSQKFKDTHLSLSLKLIAEVIKRKHSKYNHLNEADIISNLNKCMSTPSKFSINKDAFTMSTGNLSHDKVAELFSPFGINIAKMYDQDRKFLKYLEDSFGPSITNIKPSTLYDKINDLVIRRNEISHGGEVVNILGLSAFEDYLVFLENYGEAIFNSISHREKEVEMQEKYKKIEKKYKLYDKNTILAFELENYNIKVGEHIVVYNEKNEYITRNILNIQKNNVTYHEIKIIEKTDIAIKLDGRIQLSNDFYLPLK